MPFDQLENEELICPICNNVCSKFNDNKYIKYNYRCLCDFYLTFVNSKDVAIFFIRIDWGQGDIYVSYVYDYDKKSGQLMLNNNVINIDYIPQLNNLKESIDYLNSMILFA